MTGEEWDTHWWVIFNDLPADMPRDEAAALAERECVEQFGDRAEDVAS